MLVVAEAVVNMMAALYLRVVVVMAVVVQADLIIQVERVKLAQLIVVVVVAEVVDFLTVVQEVQVLYTSVTKHRKAPFITMNLSTNENIFSNLFTV